MGVDQAPSAGAAGLPKGRWSEYTQLSRQIKQAGLLERRRGWYAARIGVNLALLAAGVAAFAVLGSPGGSWSRPPTWRWCSPNSPSSAMTPATARSSAPARQRPGRPGPWQPAVGISFGWWVRKHNAHHSNPNHEDLDPDISIAALAFTDDQASSKHGLVRLIARYQAWLFFPLLLLEAAHLHLASIKAILQGRPDQRWSRGCCCWPMSPPMSAVLVLVLSPAAGGGVRASSSRACSACTWVARSPPTTRACRPSPRPMSWTSSAARC